MHRQYVVQDTTLFPAIYRAKGLLQAHFDCLGGSPEEYNIRGTNDGALFTTLNNRIIVPADKGGGKISWMRGVWMADVAFRYDGFMSDLRPTQSLPAATNYLGASNSGIQDWHYGAQSIIDITTAAGVVTGVSIVEGGRRYEVGNIVPVNGGNNDAWFTVTSVSGSGALLGIGSLVGGTGYVDGETTCKPAINLPDRTVITLPIPIADGTQVQAYFTMRDGSLVEKGAALSGYPNRRSSMRESDYGTANDGDLYVANSLYFAHAATGVTQYKTMADRLMTAQVERSFGLGQVVPFDIPLEAETGSAGIYYYNGGGSPWHWDVEEIPNEQGTRGLHVVTNVDADGPPYGFAGWGTWPAWPVTTASPFNNYTFDFWGNGKGGGIQLSTNIFQPALASGEYVYGFACLPTDAGIKRTFVADKRDFWNTTNVLYNQDRSSTYKGASSSDGSATLTVQAVDNISQNGYSQFYNARCAGSPTAEYANFFFGTNNEGFDSAGSTTLHIDIKSSIPTELYITLTDAADKSFEYYQAAGLGVIDSTLAVDYVDFVPETLGATITHPIKQVSLQPFPNATLEVNNIICGELRTLANPANPIELLGGFQFGFGVGEFDCYWKNCQINQTATDPYPGISRYTYGYIKTGKSYGRGSWQGQIAVGYMWLLGYLMSDIRYPANSIARYPDGSSFDYSGLPVVYCVRKFMEDSQLAFESQYPAEQAGPMVANYGAWAWEFVAGIGNIGGEIVPNAEYPLGVLNQFYFAKDGSIGGGGGKVDPAQDGSWPGYETRAIVSLAEDYFVSGDLTSKRALEKWIQLIADQSTWDAVGKVVRLPVNIYGDGTINLSNSLYSLNCVGEALLYKLWRDDDATARIWLPRIIEDLNQNFKITELGKVYGVFPLKGGTGYNYATATLSDPTGTGAVIKPFLAGGEITHYDILSEGTGYTNPTITITGDGTGAVGNPYLSDLLFGGYDRQHTGWEIAEMGKFLGMMMHPRSELGPINYTFALPASVPIDYADLRTFYENNSGPQRPSIVSKDGYPLHEYTWSSFHWNSSIEDPVSYNGTQGGSRDTHSDGDSWTESIGPSMFYAVDVLKDSGDNTWLQQMYELCQYMQDEAPTPITPGESFFSRLYNGENLDVETSLLPNVDCGIVGNRFPNVVIDLGELT